MKNSNLKSTPMQSYYKLGCSGFKEKFICSFLKVRLQQHMLYFSNSSCSVVAWFSSLCFSCCLQ